MQKTAGAHVWREKAFWRETNTSKNLPLSWVSGIIKNPLTN